jgi:ATP-binding cassette, subfamily B, bacterial MsbA
MNIISYFRKQILKYKLKFLLLIVLMIVNVFLESAKIGIFYPLINLIQGNIDIDGQKFNFIYNFFTGLGISMTFTSTLLLLFITMTFSLITDLSLKIIPNYIYNPLIQDVRNGVFNKILNLPLEFMSGFSSGKFITVIRDETEHIGQVVNHLIILLTNCFLLFLYIAFTLYLSWEIALLVALIILLRYKIVGYFFSHIRARSEEYTRLWGNVNSYLIGVNQGIDVIKTSSTEDIEKKRFKSKTGMIKKTLISITNLTSSSEFIDNVLNACVLCLIVYISVVICKLDIALLVLFLYLLNRIAPKIGLINSSRIKINEFSNKIIFLKKIIEYEKSNNIKEGNINKDNFNEAIKFNNVSFSYHGNDDFKIKNLNATIYKNEVVAIIGESGSGKTTFIRLLLNLYKPQNGYVSIDNLNILNIKTKLYQSLIGLVNQDTFIFDDTIENNIAYGISNYSEKDFIEAVNNASADEFIYSLPNKQKELVGERGIKISGGQRQRIAIARAFLKNSPILILDEATSSLDSVTEAKIQNSLEILEKNRTMIIIAHRLSTIKNADKILVFDKGRIVEVGKHEELIKHNGLYSKYYRQQKF